MSDKHIFGDVTISDRVEVRFQDKWSHKGHVINGGLASPDKKFFYVNIPKNSSSYVKTKLLSLGWTFESIEDFPDATPIVVLRDPVRRWLSGIAEYLMQYHLPKMDASGFYSEEMGFKGLFGQTLAIDLILQNVCFDDHTEKQCLFLQGLKSLKNVVWFKSDKTFSATFDKFLVEQGYDVSDTISDPENSNDEETSARRNGIKQFFEDYIRYNPGWIPNLEDFYVADKHLLDTVKFYE